MKGLYSKRQFAEVACKSVATIDKLISAGLIMVDKSGYIPATELGYFLKETLFEYPADNVLVLSALPEEEVASVNISAVIDEVIGRSNASRYDSIETLIKDVSEEVISLTASNESLYTEKLRRKALDEFIKRYNAAIDRQFSTIKYKVLNAEDACPESIRKLGIEDLLKMLVSGGSSDDLEAALQEATTPKHNAVTLADSFDNIIKALGIKGRNVDNMVVPLFNRGDITFDFLCKKGKLYNSLIVSGKMPDKDITFFVDSSISDITKGNNPIGDSLCKSLYPVAVNRIVDKGIVTYCNCYNQSRNTIDYSGIFRAITKGFYKKVVFVGGTNHFVENALAGFVSVLNLAKVEYRGMQFIEYQLPPSSNSNISAEM